MIYINFIIARFVFVMQKEGALINIYNPVAYNLSYLFQFNRR